MVNLIPRLLRVIIPLCGFFCVISCTKQDSPVQADTVEKLLSINGGSNTYTVSNVEKTGWQITECPEWVTPVCMSGSASDDIQLYIESNARHALRTGNVTVTYTNGVTYTTRVDQSNEKPDFNLQRSYAVGWSFDVRTYMDSRGLKEQIFNTQKIYNADPDMYCIEPNSSSELNYYYGESGSDLSKDMSGKLDVEGKYNLFSLNLQASFGKSALDNSKRIFSWIRNVYTQQIVYLNQFDLEEAQEEGWFTADFTSERKRVIDSGGSDEAIRLLVEHYGTHIILQSLLGGCYDYYYSSVVEQHNDNLNIQAAIEFGFSSKFKLNADATYKDDFENLSNETIEKFSVKGGDAITLANAVESGTVTNEMTDAWLASLRDQNKLELISFKITSISALFPDNIADKIDNYMERMYYKDINVTRSVNNIN